LNDRGEVTEGSSTNIFWVMDRMLFTPALECGLLPGITREVLMSLGPEVGLRVKEGRFSLNELKKSGGAFLTNSLIGISAITSIDGDEISLDEDLFKVIRGSLFKRLGWV
jgi:4-amino-4-deoxychorismate lyase